MARARQEIGNAASLNRKTIGSESSVLQSNLLPSRRVKNYANKFDVAKIEGEKINSRYLGYLKYLQDKMIHSTEIEKKDAHIKERADSHYDFAYHLSVLRIYYYFCYEQADSHEEKMLYLNLAKMHSDQSLEQIELSFELYIATKDKEETHKLWDELKGYHQIIQRDITHLNTVEIQHHTMSARAVELDDNELRYTQTIQHELNAPNAASERIVSASIAKKSTDLDDADLDGSDIESTVSEESVEPEKPGSHRGSLANAATSTVYASGNYAISRPSPLLTQLMNLPNCVIDGVGQTSPWDNLFRSPLTTHSAHSSIFSFPSADSTEVYSRFSGSVPPKKRAKFGLFFTPRASSSSASENIISDTLDADAYQADSSNLS